MANDKEIASTDFVKTGIRELDCILNGGLEPNRVYLVEGAPGSGKTTLALQFLLEGVKEGEKGLYITLSETRAELIKSAASHNWNLDGIEICDLGASESDLQVENQYTMFQPSEIELSVTTQVVLDFVERIRPTRVVFDSLSEMRLLAQSALRFRRQVLALKQYFAGRQTTVLLLDDRTSDLKDLQLQSIAHGVITLEQLSPEYGAERRRLRITKMRGKKYQGGYHDFNISLGGTEIFPRLVAAAHKRVHAPGQLKSGIDSIDALLGGGIEFGVSVLLVGPAGAGKSTFAMQYARHAAEQGQRAVIFSFEESLETIFNRMRGLGLPVEDVISSGHLTIYAIDPAELSPGEFGHIVRRHADPEDGSPGATVVVIDSLNGYLNAMPEEHFLTIQLHEMLTYLGHRGVVTFILLAQHGVLGTALHGPVDTSYLTDAVILFRYFEYAGEFKVALSVVKKRSGRHERTIREYSMSEAGISVGEPLRNFHGVLSGTPTLLENPKSPVR